MRGKRGKSNTVPEKNDIFSSAGPILSFSDDLLGPEMLHKVLMLKTQTKSFDSIYCTKHINLLQQNTME